MKCEGFLFVSLAVMQGIQTILSYRLNSILVPTQNFKLARVSNNDICNTVKEPGHCDGQEEVWYYDAQDDQCYFFLYSGCGGNGNRFPTLDACKRTCVREPQCAPMSCPPGCVHTKKFGRCPKCTCRKDSAQKICHQVQRRGNCRALQHKWSYSTKEHRCVQFVYGGCGGNENKFETERECHTICAGM